MTKRDEITSLYREWFVEVAVPLLVEVGRIDALGMAPEGEWTEEEAKSVHVQLLWVLDEMFGPLPEYAVRRRDRDRVSLDGLLQQLWEEG